MLDHHFFDTKWYHNVHILEEKKKGVNRTFEQYLCTLLPAFIKNNFVITLIIEAMNVKIKRRKDR
jgi:hypothetical protein